MRISHGQVPVVMAVGSSSTDAVNRLNSERFFSRAPVSKGWYQWQWIGTLPRRSFSYKATVPKKLNAILLDNNLFNDERITKIASNVGFKKRNAGTINFDENGNRMITSRKIQLNVNRDGALNIHFGRPNIKNTEMMDESRAINIAHKFIKDLDFDKGMELKPGHIRHRFTSGGTMKGSGTMEGPSVVETIVQFRKAIHGIISKTTNSRGKSSGRVKVLLERVGYDFSGKLGLVVRQRDVDIPTGKNLMKRYKIRLRVMG